MKITINELKHKDAELIIEYWYQYDGTKSLQ